MNVGPVRVLPGRLSVIKFKIFNSNFRFQGHLVMLMLS